MKFLHVFCVFCIFTKLQLTSGENKEAEDEGAATEEPEVGRADDSSQLFMPSYKSILLGPGNAQLSLHLGPYIRKSLALTEHRHEADTIQFNLKIIEEKINNNYKNSLKLLNKLSKKFSWANKYFHVSEDGFQCDSKFCGKFGDGEHSFGICSPYSCRCIESNAEGMKCKKNLIFDPVFEMCSTPIEVKACGF